MEKEPTDVPRELETGIPTIDDQHRKLLVHLDSLRRAVGARCSREILCEYLAEFADLAIRHFESEEEIMQQMRFAGLLEHSCEHKALVQELEGFAERFGRDGNLPFSVVLDFLHDWVFNHLTVCDRAYIDQMRKFRVER